MLENLTYRNPVEGLAEQFLQKLADAEDREEQYLAMIANERARQEGLGIERQKLGLQRLATQTEIIRAKGALIGEQISAELQHQGLINDWQRLQNERDQLRIDQDVANAEISANRAAVAKSDSERLLAELAMDDAVQAQLARARSPEHVPPEVREYFETRGIDLATAWRRAQENVQYESVIERMEAVRDMSPTEVKMKMMEKQAELLKSNPSLAIDWQNAQEKGTPIEDMKPSLQAFARTMEAYGYMANNPTEYTMGEAKLIGEKSGIPTEVLRQRFPGLYPLTGGGTGGATTGPAGAINAFVQRKVEAGEIAPEQRVGMIKELGRAQGEEADRRREQGRPPMTFDETTGWLSSLTTRQGSKEEQKVLNDLTRAALDRDLIFPGEEETFKAGLKAYWNRIGSVTEADIPTVIGILMDSGGMRRMARGAAGGESKEAGVPVERGAPAAEGEEKETVPPPSEPTTPTAAEPRVPETRPLFSGSGGGLIGGTGLQVPPFQNLPRVSPETREALGAAPRGLFRGLKSGVSSFGRAYQETVEGQRKAREAREAEGEEEEEALEEPQKKPKKKTRSTMTL